jgi:hypothetical protein
LLLALHTYELPILTDTGNRIGTVGGYEIEIEANGLFKLRSDGAVVAPFDDLDELCRFIQH